MYAYIKSVEILSICSQDIERKQNLISIKGHNSVTRGRNFALNGTQGEVGFSLKKKIIFFFFFFFFYRETHFHSVTTQMQAVVTLSDNLLPLHRVSPSIKWQ